MNSTVSEILYAFCNVFLIPGISILFFLRVAKELKFNKWIIFIVSIVINSIVSFLYLNGHIQTRAITLATFHGILLLIALFASKDKLINKIINIIIYYAVMLMFDLFTYMMIGLAPSAPYWVASFLFGVIMSLVLYLAEQILKSSRDKEIDRRAFVFIIIPLSQIVTFVSFGIIFIKLFPKHLDLLALSNLFSTTAAIFIAVSIILSFIADIIAFRQYIKNLDTAKIEAENKALEYKNKLNTNYFNELKENETELRKIKHDIGGCLETMKEILYTEKNIEKAQDFFDEMSRTLGNITTGFYSNNSLINAIIISKSKICSSKSINLNVDINIPEQINISDIDICRALVNMLDNAIEANEKTDKEKYVNLSIKELDGLLYIHTDNPFNGEAIGATTKANPKEHGYGLKILNDFAKKYDGYIKTEIKSNTVSSLMVMRNDIKQY